jgi:lactoylglutathione lyase
MRIEHIAIWTSDLEKMKNFYETYFNGQASSKYHNTVSDFQSYFISFDDTTRLELMSKPYKNQPVFNEHLFGLTHFAISVGCKEMVNLLTMRLHNDGFNVISQPRTTGDNYYESVISDPEGNLIEITVQPT